jgi:hypothetical protein
MNYHLSTNLILFTNERAYKAGGATFTHADGDNMTICICDILPG